VKRIPYAVAAVVAALTALAIGVVSATAGSSSSPGSMHMHMTKSAQAGLNQSDLTTNLGVTGSPAFPAEAKALDRNSVALSKSIAAVYGKAAGKTFLDGKFMWRDHIRFFVDYTVATAKGDKAGQARAVNGLKRYTVVFGNFLAGATGLPPRAVQQDLLQHVLELKAQLDAYSNKQYPRGAAIYQDAYAHMFMTGDLLAGAIAKQKDLPK
jgi:hypothetical protein